MFVFAGNENFVLCRLFDAFEHVLLLLVLIWFVVVVYPCCLSFFLKRG